MSGPVLADVAVLTCTPTLGEHSDECLAFNESRSDDPVCIEANGLGGAVLKMGDYTAEADYYFDVSYCDGLVIITCPRCGGFELVAERSREGRRRARGRMVLHLIEAHASARC